MFETVVLFLKLGDFLLKTLKLLVQACNLIGSFLARQLSADHILYVFAKHALVLVEFKLCPCQLLSFLLLAVTLTSLEFLKKPIFEAQP